MPAPAPRWVLLTALSSGLLATPGSPLEYQGLRRLVERGRHPAIRWGRFSDVQPDARRLYLMRGWNPLWLSANRPTREARALLDVLATAGDRGLDPQDYDAAQLAALAANLDRRGADSEQAIRFDVALTIGALRLTRALARGRVGPRDGVLLFDPVPVVEALHRAGNPEPLLAALEPPWTPYRELKRALARYRRLARDSVQRRPWYLARIRQMELALERWRWLPRELDEPTLFVSLPFSRLKVSLGRNAVFRMSARAGSRECRALQAFGGQLSLLVFRPAVSSQTVRFPFAENLYLYAGPDRAGPGAAGCLQVADGELLAELLLRDRLGSDWSRERIAEAMAGNRQRFVRLRRPVSVVVLYGTAMTDDNGQVSFTPDLYGHDRRLDELLRKGYPYP